MSVERHRGDEEPERPRARERGARATMVAASIAVALLLSEGIARLWSDEVYIQIPLDRGGLWVPYVAGAEADLVTDEFRVRYRIDSRGLRGPERDWESPPARGRVLLLGDSFSAGWGVEYAQTFAARLEASTGIELVNAGRPGGCPLWYVHQARQLPGELRADALLVQIFDNDPSDNQISAGVFGTTVGARAAELPEALDPARAPGRLERLLERSVLRRRLRRAAIARSGLHVTRQPFLDAGARPGTPLMTREEAIARYRITLSRKAIAPDDCRFYDDPDGALWQPRLAWQRRLVEQLLDESAARRLPVAVVYIPVYQWFLWGRPAGSNPHAQLLREACASRGVPFLDATVPFAALPEPARLYYARDGHLDAEGHEALARALAPLVDDLLHFLPSSAAQEDRPTPRNREREHGARSWQIDFDQTPNLRGPRRGPGQARPLPRVEAAFTA